MNFANIKQVLNFGAFRPEPDDHSAAWSRRFPHQRTLLLNVGRSQTTWQVLGKGGKLLDGGSQSGEFKEVAEQCGLEWRKATDAGWCALSLNNRYVISLETNLSRKPGVEEVIRSNPRAALGSRYERGKRYSLTHNPESVASILLSCDEEQIRKIEETLKEHDLKPGRISCGTYAMLVRLLEKTNRAASEKSAKTEGRPADRLYVICCEGSVCAMLQNGDLWSELRSRSDLYSDDLAPALDLVHPLAMRLGDQAEIFLVCDSDGTGLADALREKFKGVTVEDFSVPNHFWKVLADLS